MCALFYVLQIEKKNGPLKENFQSVQSWKGFNEEYNKDRHIMQDDWRYLIASQIYYSANRTNYFMQNKRARQKYSVTCEEKRRRREASSNFFRR